MMKSVLLDFSKAETRILEVGCGAGGFSIFASKKCKKCEHVTGIDIGRTRIKMANKLGKRLEGKVSFVVGDAQHLPFKDGSHDIVVCSETLEHVADHLKAFHELVRVTKKLGYVIITVPNNLSLAQLDKLQLSTSYFAVRRSQPKDLHIFNNFVIKKLVNRKDLRVLTKCGVDLIHIPSPRPKIVSLENGLNRLLGRYFHRLHFFCLNIGIIAQKTTE